MSAQLLPQKRSVIATVKLSTSVEVGPFVCMRALRVELAGGPSAAQYDRRLCMTLIEIRA